MVFVIAECGVNWRDLVDADQMIKAAAQAGADAVKFQCYKPNFNDICISNLPFHPRGKELNQIALDESTIRYLYWRCQQHGVEFMCTPMYPAAVAMLDPYVKRWKVRHADSNNHELLDAINRTNPCKEVLMSINDPGLLK